MIIDDLKHNRCIGIAIDCMTRLNKSGRVNANDVQEWLVKGSTSGRGDARRFAAVMDEVYGAEEVAKFTRFQLFNAIEEHLKTLPVTHDTDGNPINRRRSRTKRNAFAYAY